MSKFNYMMKIKLAFLLLTVNALAYSQSLEFGFNVGTGSTYLVENSDKTVNINYKTPTTISTDLTFTLENSNFGVVVRYQFTGTSVDGNKWFDLSESYFKARVNDNTFLLLLEYLKRNEKKLNFGANFGMGYTKQIINFENEDLSTNNSFPSIQIGGLINYKLNNKLSLKLQPSFQFFDPINGLSNNKLNLAKEDIHFLMQLGISYQLK